MRRQLILVIALVVLGACGASAARSPGSVGWIDPGASAATAPACGPRGAQTLAADTSARVYATGTSVYGCAAGSASAFKLGGTGTCINSARVGVASLAGRVTGYAVTRCGIDTGSTTVEVRRLPSGSLLYSQAAHTVTAPESYTSVSAIVVSAAGGVAWIGETTSIVHRGTNVAVLIRRGHGVATLDPGPGIGSHSLRLRGSTVSWRHGSARRSARLG